MYSVPSCNQQHLLPPFSLHCPKAPIFIYRVSLCFPTQSLYSCVFRIEQCPCICESFNFDAHGFYGLCSFPRFALNSTLEDLQSSFPTVNRRPAKYSVQSSIPGSSEGDLLHESSVRFVVDCAELGEYRCSTAKLAVLGVPVAVART